MDQSFITGTTGPTAVAVDAGHVYWANFGGSIGRANIDGTSPNNTFIGGVIEPFGLAVNSQYIYWSNENGLAIGRAAIDGSSVNQTFMTPHAVTGVAVDSTYIYWAGINNSDPMNPAPEIGRALLNGTSSNPSFITGGEPYGIAVAGPQAVATPASPTPFSTTAQGTLGAPATLTINNSGGDNLSISGLVFTGEDPGDFIITSDGCLGLVAPGASCQMTVAFVPQGQGARSATLQILSNDRFSPLLVRLSGTGGALPQGPAGQRGPTGVTGPRGPAGPAGKIELVTCTTTTKKVHGHRRAVTQLLLSDLRPLRHGRYTLTTRSRRGRHLTTRRAALTIG